MKRVDDPSTVAELLGQDRETHIYGLADLEEPFWSNSEWYIRRDAAVGVISDGSKWVGGYAMSRKASDDTLGLLVDLQEKLQGGTWITGPPQMSQRLRPERSLKSIGPHWRMMLDGLDQVPPPERAVSLDQSRLGAVSDLMASDPDGAFFIDSMLDQNTFVGVFEDDQLVAMAGTHVASHKYGVAAIGAVLTRPSHRGQGLGHEVMSAVCHRLYAEFETIGLNVSAGNETAMALYGRLGFRRAFEYEEIELL